MACATLSLDVADPNDISPRRRPRTTAKMLTARFPTIVAAHARIAAGQGADRAARGSVAGGQLPLHGARHASRIRSWPRALDTYWVTVIDHGMNASTFTARVIASTRSDMVSAVTGAIGALKGPLHGGAPGPVLDMLVDIGRADRAEAWLKQRARRTAGASWDSGTASTRCAIRAPRC